MKKLAEKGILFGVLFLVAQYVVAEESVTLTRLVDFYDQGKLESALFNSKQAGDLSIEFLEFLFGAVGGLNGRNVIMGELFRSFNYGVLSLVSFMIGYAVLASVMGSAQDGTGAFSTRVSPWMLFRTTTGVTLMFPLTNGYSLIQIMVMKIVLLGISLANTAWDATLTYYHETGGQGIIVSNEQSPNLLENTTAMSDYLSDTYIQLWDVYDGLCKGKENCRVNMRVEELHYGFGEDISIPVTLSSGSRTKQVKLAVPLSKFNPGSKEEQAFLWSNYWLAAEQARMLVTPSFRRLFRDVQDHYNHPLYVFDESVAERKGSSWEIAHSCSAGVPLAEKKQVCRLQSQRMHLLAQTISLAAYEYAATIESAVAPFLKSTSSEEESWIESARSRGWLSSGMYYTQLMSHAEETNTSHFKILVSMLDDTERNSKLIGYDAQFSPQKTKNEFSLSGLVEVYQDALMKNVYVDDDSNEHTETMISGGGRIKQTVHSDDKNLMRRKLKTLSVDDKDVLDYLKMMRPYQNREHETFNLLPPNLSGSISNSAAAGPQWIWGLDPTLPIQYMTRMMLRVLESLLGLNQNNALGCDFYDGNKTFFDFVGHKKCFIRGSLLYTVLYPLDNVNPISMIKGLGQQMIKQSVQYYHKTIEGLFRQTEKMADAFFRDSSLINITAVAAETATYGSTNAPIGVAFATVAEIAIAGLKMGYNGTKVAMEIYIPLGTAVAATLFTLGIILGVYLPMLPFLLFLFGTVAWLMSVAEAMVAAPLVALGITHPEGHDLMGKAEQSLMLFLGIFIRPITMLFGILMAIMVSQILLKLFHLGFVSVIFSMLPSSNDSVELSRLAIVLIGALLVYIYVLMNVIEQSYSLIYQIPERILRWVGGPQEQTGIAQLAEQTKGETQQAAGQAAQGASQATSAPQLQATEGDVQQAPDKDLADKDDDDGGGSGGGKATGSGSNGGSGATAKGSGGKQSGGGKSGGGKASGKKK